MTEITCANYAEQLDKNTVVIDTRSNAQFKKGHFPNSINLMIGGKFETWLGSIIAPNEPFYLAAETERELDELIKRIAKIGYEKQIKGAFTGNGCVQTPDKFDLEYFKLHLADYTIVDIRNTTEVKKNLIFANSIHIPLPELRERIGEIPSGKPIVVHCAAGYRSAAGSSILKSILTDTVIYDLGEAITTF